MIENGGGGISEEMLKKERIDIELKDLEIGVEFEDLVEEKIKEVEKEKEIEKEIIGKVKENMMGNENKKMIENNLREEKFRKQIRV